MNTKINTHMNIRQKVGLNEDGNAIRGEVWGRILILIFDCDGQVGQDEMVILLVKDGEDPLPPRDVFLHLNEIFMHAKQGNAENRGCFSFSCPSKFCGPQARSSGASDTALWHSVATTSASSATAITLAFSSYANRTSASARSDCLKLLTSLVCSWRNGRSRGRKCSRFVWCSDSEQNIDVRINSFRVFSQIIQFCAFFSQRGIDFAIFFKKKNLFFEKFFSKKKIFLIKKVFFQKKFIFPKINFFFQK